jgi:hypothetical protein
MDVATLTEPPLLYVLIALAVLIVGAIVWGVVASKRRRAEQQRLRERYGSEYERTVAEHRSTRAAVADLRQREQRHDELEVRTLNDADRDLVRRDMATAQFRFVEDPAEAILQAQRVVTETLRAKGYPIGDDRDEAVRLFSVDHPEHAGAVRTLLEGRHDGDTDSMRRMFLGSRKVLQDVAGVSFVREDATATADDLRVEHDAHAAHTSS